MTEFEISERKGSAEVIIRGKLEGIVSLNFENFFEHDVIKRAEANIGINLNSVDYIDSKGLGALVKAIHLCHNNSKTLVLFGISHELESIFHFARLDQVFKIINYTEYKEQYPL